MLSSPLMTARPKPFGPLFLTATSSGILLRIAIRRSHVLSVLPSSMTMISCGTRWIRSSTCRCSTVEQMHPSSLRAGIITESSERSCWPFSASVILPRSNLTIADYPARGWRFHPESLPKA
jgi:hypothetical protein